MEPTPESTVRSSNSDPNLAILNRDTWQQLTAAPTQKENAFKTCTLATVSPNALPDARIVVLRQADETRRMLWFHTDVRTQKVAHLKMNSDAVLLFWDDNKQTQLRCRVTATIHTDDAVANDQWAKTWEGSRKMYLSEYEPGHVQPEPYPGFPVHFGEELPTRAESEAGRPNFAVIECKVVVIDYLHLSRAGQTRAQFTYDEKAVQYEWLAP